MMQCPPLKQYWKQITFQQSCQDYGYSTNIPLCYPASHLNDDCVEAGTEQLLIFG